jgi:AraC-like DNA-binding protein
MESIGRLLKRSMGGLSFGHTKIGEKVGMDLAKLPSLPGPQQLLTLLSALLDLAGDSDATVLSMNRVQPTCRVEDQQRIDVICKYLNNHYQDEIDFAKLASKLHMSLASLCRFFKRATGRTMTQYVNEIRVSAAAQLLTNTDRSILDIGFDVGFGNYSNFNRQFKRIKGQGPRELRNQFLATSDASKSIA